MTVRRVPLTKGIIVDDVDMYPRYTRMEIKTQAGP